jgi:hypothetical protein
MATAQQRLAGLTGTLLVQAGFISLFIYASAPASRIKPLTKELFLFLRPAQRPVPAGVIDARGKSRNPSPGSRALPQSNAPIAIVPAPPSSLEAFGRSLFGCAPENYARLAADERTRCPPPGEGLAKWDDRNLLTPPKSRAKDEAYWQEQWNRAHWRPGLCPVGKLVVGCLLEQVGAENRRAQAADTDIEVQTAKRLQEPQRPVPQTIGPRRP